MIKIKKHLGLENIYHEQNCLIYTIKKSEFVGIPIVENSKERETNFFLCQGGRYLKHILRIFTMIKTDCLNLFNTIIFRNQIIIFLFTLKG